MNTSVRDRGLSVPEQGKYTVFCAMLAAAYAGILSQVPNEEFRDWANYIWYAQDAWELFANNWTSGEMRWLANEPLWLIFNAAAAELTYPEATVRLIIFTGAYLVAFQVLMRGPQHFIWLLLILLFPGVIKNFTIQLRQGLALGIFICGYYSATRSHRLLFMGVSALIHSSFIFVCIVYGFTYLCKRCDIGAIGTLVGVMICGLISPAVLGQFAGILGARQFDEYSFVGPDVSGAAFVIYTMVLALFVAEGRGFVSRNTFAAAAIMFYLSTYFTLEVTARIFESSLVVVLLACTGLTQWRFPVCWAIITTFCGLQWYLRWSQPLFGFGLE